MGLEKIIEDEKKKEAAAAAAKAKADEERRRTDELKKKADDKKKADEKRKLAEKKKADEKKRLEAKALADAKAKLIDSARISALIDKSPDQKPAATSAPPPSAPTKATGLVKGDPTGTAARNAGASLFAGIMRRAVSRCWKVNIGLEGVEKVVVKIEVKLTRDGEISGQPRIANNQGSPLFQDAANNAMRALVQFSAARQAKRAQLEIVD